MNNSKKSENQKELYTNGTFLGRKITKKVSKFMKIISYWTPPNLKIIACFKIVIMWIYLIKFNKIHNGPKLFIQTCQLTWN